MDYIYDVLYYFKEFYLPVLSLLVPIIVGIRSYYVNKKIHETDIQLKLAEEKAFVSNIEINKLLENISNEPSKNSASEISQLVDVKNTLTINNLFDIYSKQIQKYQLQTRARASWSFGFAIFSMLMGLGFVLWGGSVILQKVTPQDIVSGAAISAIGGAVSAYITKTFLDVHKLSLLQLNRYFRQPVLNDHILMAQRLADHLEDSAAKQRAYEKIIDSISGLIVENFDDILFTKTS